MEKTVALAVAKRVAVMSQTTPAVEVVLTRAWDKYVRLGDRCQEANVSGAVAFISIHCNGFRKPSAHGWEIYTYPGWSRADPLATQIAEAWGRVFPDVLFRADWSDGDVDKERELYVLKYTQMPAVLVETGFITHAETEREMQTERWQERAARAIYSGIIAWLDEGGS
jgi:N-acetylmuramoyl-L-alanine amidase